LKRGAGRVQASAFGSPPSRPSPVEGEGEHPRPHPSLPPSGGKEKYRGRGKLSRKQRRGGNQSIFEFSVPGLCSNRIRAGKILFGVRLEKRDEIIRVFCRKQGEIRVHSHLEKGRKEGISIGYDVVGDFGGDKNSSFKKRASGRFFSFKSLAFERPMPLLCT